MAIAVPSASNAPRCATGVSSLTTVWLITLMTEGTAMLIVASAILVCDVLRHRTFREASKMIDRLSRG